MKQYISTYFLIAIFATSLLSSCYRMPEEGEVSVVPNVNNPKYKGKNDQKNAVLPSFDY